MSWFFSPSQRGFYNDDLHKSMPPDCRPVTDDRYTELMSGQSARRIEPDANGDPQLVDRTFTVDELKRRKRKAVDLRFRKETESGMGIAMSEIRFEALRYRVAEQTGTPVAADFPLLDAMAQENGRTLADEVLHCEQQASRHGLLAKKRSDLIAAVDAVDDAESDAREKINAVDETELDAVMTEASRT